jgi:hypothetical protein
VDWLIDSVTNTNLVAWLTSTPQPYGHNRNHFTFLLTLGKDTRNSSFGILSSLRAHLMRETPSLL